MTIDSQNPPQNGREKFAIIKFVVDNHRGFYKNLA